MTCHDTKNWDTVVNAGSSVRLVVTGGKFLRWEPALYLDNPNSCNPVSVPQQDIEYRLICSTEYGCSDTVSIKITVRKDVSILNAFTLDGDGIKDWWVITNIERVTNSTLRTYDRSGSIVAAF